MEMLMMMKNEEGVVIDEGMRKRRCVGDIGESRETISVKRRRRDTAAKVGENGGAISSPTTVKRSSKYRGVSKHRWTGRYEAHLWDKLSWNVTQKKKGKQVYLGAYDDEEAAARAYDLAALKYWGNLTFMNFPISDYEKEIEIMQTLTKEEYLASLRRKSSGFSRGVSKYRGVARHHHNGRWEARIGRVFGNKYLYLGTYGTQEEAAHAYDIAAIEYRGINAVTNFDLSSYIRWLKPGSESSIVAQETKPTYEVVLSSKKHIKKESMYEREIPLSTCRRPSSPTALGLLLRSSVFRELVEKNPNLSEEADQSSDDESNKNVVRCKDQYGASSYNNPFVLSSNSNENNQLQEQLYYNSDILGLIQ